MKKEEQRKRCGNCYFCDDSFVLATTCNGSDVTKSRCKLLLNRWVNRSDVCEFHNKRNKERGK